MSFTNHVSCAVVSDWAGHFSQCLYDWQGLEGAGLALFAAYLSIRSLRKQIEQDHCQHTNEIARQHNAARLTMPLVLAALDDLVSDMSDRIAGRMERYWLEERDVGEQSTAIHIVPPKFDRVNVPPDVLMGLGAFVETLANKRDIRHVAEMVSTLQVFIARFNSFDPGHAAPNITFNSLMMDAAKVKLLLDRMYNYARFVDDESFGVVDVISHSDIWDEIHRKALSLVFFRTTPDDFFSGFRQSVDSYKSNEINPWNEKFSD